MQTDWQTDIMRYCEEKSSPESGFLKDLTRFTWLNTTNPRQLSGHLQGQFLSFISAMLRPDCVLEIGTFTGYATFCLASGLSQNGILHTIEADEEMLFKAKNQFNLTPLKNKIKFIAGNALDIIPDLNIKPDLIFVDADKISYQKYFDLCLPILSERGVMLFDNTLWSGKVADATTRESDADTRNMHAFNTMLANQNDLEILLLPLRDGLTIVRKK
jgi:caffeoyl-CoA O-methyltransferase